MFVVELEGILHCRNETISINIEPGGFNFTRGILARLGWNDEDIEWAMVN